MRDSMVFYRSFYEALKNLPPEQFKESMKALMEYGLNGEEPETSGIEKTIFLLVKPQIDANNKRYLNGTKGGRKAKSSEPDKNQSLTKQEPKPNQTRTKAEPNVNDNVNENVNEKDIYIAREGEPLRLFEDFWQAYPKRASRMLAEQAYVQLLSTTEALREEQVVAAAKNYAEACRILGTKEKYICMPHNWLESRALDYLPENYKKPEAPRENKNGTGFSNFEQRDYDFDELERQLLESQEAQDEC